VRVCTAFCFCSSYLHSLQPRAFSVNYILMMTSLRLFWEHSSS